MARTGITGDQVQDETITDKDILDGTITRQDLNVTSTGKAVVRKILPGVCIKSTSTGIDPGTGDVTLSLAIPFHPNTPNILPTSTGYNFSWNPSTLQWEVTERVAAHRQVWNPEITTIVKDGTLSLTSTSHSGQILLGSSTGYSIVLPDARTLDVGFKYELYNTTISPISVKDNSNTLLFTLAQASISYIYLQNNSTQAGVWIRWQIVSTTVTASGIINYTVVSDTAFSSSTRNPSYAAITGFSVTPQTGTYLVLYNASVYYTTTPKGHWWAIFKNGSKVENTERRQDTAHSNQTMVDSTQGVIQFNGAESCDVRVSCDNTGTITVNARSLTLIRFGT